MKEFVYFTVGLLLQIITKGESCTISGLPLYQSHSTNSITGDQVQAIVPGYRFNCGGRVTGWGGCFSPNSNDDRYHVIYQVWREETPGCYRLIGPTSLSPAQDVSDLLRLEGGCNTMELSPENQIVVEEGDVIGFYVDYWTRFGGIVFFNANFRTAGFQIRSTNDIQFYYKRESVDELSTRYYIGSLVDGTSCSESNQLHLTGTGAPVITVMFEPLPQTSTDSQAQPTSSTIIFSTSPPSSTITTTSSSSSFDSISSIHEQASSVDKSSIFSVASSFTSPDHYSSRANILFSSTLPSVKSTPLPPVSSEHLLELATPSSSNTQFLFTSQVIPITSSTSSLSSHSFIEPSVHPPVQLSSYHSPILPSCSETISSSLYPSPVIITDNEYSPSHNSANYQGVIILAVAASALFVIVIISIGIVIICCIRGWQRREKKERQCATISSPKIDSVTTRYSREQEQSIMEQPSTRHNENRISMISNLMYASSPVRGAYTSNGDINNGRSHREPEMVYNPAYAASSGTDGHYSTPQTSSYLKPPPNPLHNKNDFYRTDNEGYDYVY